MPDFKSVLAVIYALKDKVLGATIISCLFIYLSWSRINEAGEGVCMAATGSLSWCYPLCVLLVTAILCISLLFAGVLILRRLK